MKSSENDKTLAIQNSETNMVGNNHQHRKGLIDAPHIYAYSFFVLSKILTFDLSMR